MRVRVLIAVTVAVLAACRGDESERPAATAAAPAVSTVVPVGFETVPLTVTNADGTVCELCVWRASTVAERRQGLMGVTDLGGADGMVFVYDVPVENRFWMRNTPIALDIAWFGVDGALVSTATMTPCLAGPDADCERYPATAPYALALEVVAGSLGELGIGPGSVATLGVGAGCDTA